MTIRNRRVLRIDPLEDRRLLAADDGTATMDNSRGNQGDNYNPGGEIIAKPDPGLIYLTNRGDLVAKGTDGNDRIRMMPSKIAPDAVDVFVQDLDNSNMRERETYSLSEFNRFYAIGNGGDDEVLNDMPIPSILEGGPGNDLIRGGSVRDLLFGDEGDDLIFGGDGDDDLYGGRGNDDLRGDAGEDQLFGDQGLDGLFGGENVDDLHGGDDPDRFLVQPGDLVHSPTQADALLTLKSSQGLVTHVYNGGSFEYEGESWADTEVQSVDVSLRAMHLRSGNTSLLKLADGQNLTLIRAGNSSLSGAAGSNMSNLDQPVIFFMDDAFTDGTTWTQQVVFHEFGHNFDHPDENTSIKEFRKLSGWTEVKPTNPFGPQYTSSDDDKWWYLSSSEFVRDYARENPYEDFGATFAAYFMTQTGQTFMTDTGYDEPEVEAPKKMKFLSEWCDSLTTQNYLT